MTRRYENPFSLSEPLHHAFWERFIHRDVEAFLKGDWAAIEDLFDAENFIAIDPQMLDNRPEHWGVVFPDLASYRDTWLQISSDMREMVDPDQLRAASYDGFEIAEIECPAEDRAILHRHLEGQIQLKSGEVMEFKGRSIYVLHLIDDEWKITSFLGYTPHSVQKSERGFAAPQLAV